MTNLTSSLTVKLIDDISKPARTAAQALQAAEKKIKDIASAMKGTGATDKFVSNLAKLKLSAKDIEAVSKAWRDYAKAQGLAANSALWTKDQVAGVKAWEQRTISALRAVKREQAAFNRSMSAAGGVHPMTAAMSANALANARLKSMHGPLAAPMSAAALAAAARPSRGLKARQILAEQTSGLGSLAMYAVPAGAGYAAAGVAGVPTAAALGAGAFAAKEAIGREAAMAAVRKKVDLAPGQTFSDVEAIARRVSRERGMAFADSTSLIAQAGQSGIPGKDLDKFATLAAKTAAAWDIPAQQAAQALAEVRAQTGWTIPQLQVYADKVNHLGDVSAAAEKSVAAMWQRSSAGAKAAGITYDDSMAILTGLRSAGMPEEVSARFLGAVTSKLRTATKEGKDFQSALKEMGLDAADLEKRMAKDGAGTFLDVLDRIGKTKNPAGTARALFGGEWFDEALRAREALAEILRLLGELRSGKGVGSLDKAITIDSSTTESALSRLKQSVLDLAGVMGAPAVSQWGGVFDGIAGGVNRAREALEDFRRVKPLDAPKGRSIADYERALKIGDPEKASAAQINAALPYARAMQNVSHFDPSKIWAKPTPPTKRRKGPPPVPTFAAGTMRPESSVLEPTPRPLPKNAPLPPRRPQMAPVEDHAPSAVGGQLPAFASGAGVVPKVDASQVEHVKSAAEGAKQALDGLGVHVAPSIDSAPVEGLKTSADGAKTSLEGLNVTVSPHVDAGSIHAAIGAADTLLAKLNAIRGAAAAAGAAIGAANARASASSLPTMAQTNRGSYSDYPDPGSHR